MSNKKDSYDVSGVPNSFLQFGTRAALELLGSGSGIFCTPLLEAVPQYIQADCEKVISHGNCYIVLGRDRPASRGSGKGGEGHTQASSIDLVVGRGGASPNATTEVDPNFRTDSARIHISQKTDIDTNFNLADGKQGNITTRSGIGIKADTVRIIGRDGIKLVTRTEPTNSQEGSASYNGIELIACNDDTDIQSMVKGENLIEALQEFEKRFNELSAVVLNLLKNQLQFNNSLTAHTHGITPSGVTSPSLALAGAGVNASLNHAEGMLDNYINRINTNINWNTRYLTSASTKYICSKYNKVN